MNWPNHPATMAAISLSLAYDQPVLSVRGCLCQTCCVMLCIEDWSCGACCARLALRVQKGVTSSSCCTVKLFTGWITFELNTAILTRHACWTYKWSVYKDNNMCALCVNKDMSHFALLSLSRGYFKILSFIKWPNINTTTNNKNRPNHTNVEKWRTDWKIIFIITRIYIIKEKSIPLSIR